MTAKEQINAIHSAVHIIRTLGKDVAPDANKAESYLINGLYAVSVAMTATLEKHYDMDGVPEKEWDAIPTDTMADYTEEVVPCNASASMSIRTRSTGRATG